MRPHWTPPSRSSTAPTSNAAPPTPQRAHHDAAVMWVFGRVFDPTHHNLAVIPNRPPPPTAVNSAGLITRTIEDRVIVPRAGLTAPTPRVALEDWGGRQLPPQGVRNS